MTTKYPTWGKLGKSIGNIPRIQPVSPPKPGIKKPKKGKK